MLWKLLEICMLRAGPQHMPSAPQFLVLALAGYFLVDVLILQMGFPLRTALAASLLDGLLLVAFVQIVLRIVAKPERFNQTLTALAGTGQLFGLLSLPLIQETLNAQAEEHNVSALVLVRMLVLAWSLLVTGHILRHAMSVSLTRGVGIGVLYTLLSMLIVAMVFPGGG